MKAVKAGGKTHSPYERHYSIPQNIAYYFRFYRENIPVFLWILLAEVIVGAIVPCVRIYFPKFAVDLVMGQADVTKLVWKLGGLGLLLMALRALQGALMEGKYHLYNAKRVNLVSSFFLKSLRIPYRETERQEVRKLYQKGLEDVCRGDNSSLYQISYGMCDMIQNVISFVLYSTVLGVLSPLMVGVLLLLSLVQYVLSFSGIKCLERFRTSDAELGRHRRYLSAVMGNAEMAKEIRLFGMKKWLDELLDKVFSDMRKQEKKKRRSENMYVQINGVLTVLRDACAYTYLISQVFRGTIGAGDFVLYFGAIMGFSGFVESMIRSVGMLQRGSNGLNFFRAYMELPEEGSVDDNAAHIRMPDEKDWKNGAERRQRHVSELTQPLEITFQDVSFSYSGLDPDAEESAGASGSGGSGSQDGSGVNGAAGSVDTSGAGGVSSSADTSGTGDVSGSGQIFRHFNLTIHGGEKVALVGVNGAGKTTFVKLLCGIYEPQEGRILLNGIDRREFPRREVYQLFSAVFQERFLPHFLVGESVSLQKEWDREKVWKVLEDAGLKNLFMDRGFTPDSYYGKEIDEEGVELSGGQEQRFLLARALYKDAPVLVLDEPTAALDPIAESQVYDSYLKFSENKTAVFISHRLASTRFSDRILLLEGGRILEEGTHRELMERGQKYAEMFQVQSRYYAKLEREKEAFS